MNALYKDGKCICFQGFEFNQDKTTCVFMCPINSSRIGDRCICDKGYVANADACMPDTQSCQLRYGLNSYGDEQYCRCSIGYEFNENKTACIKKEIEIIQHSSGTLISTANSMGVYLIDNGTKKPIKKSNIFLESGYKWEDVISISQEEMNSYPIGPEVILSDVPLEIEQFSGIAIVDGALIRAKGTTGIYLIEGSKKKPIKSAEIFLAEGYKWKDVIEVEQSVVLAYELGPEVTIDGDNESPKKEQFMGTLSEGTLARKKGSPGVYLIHNNHKRSIKSAEIFLARGYKWGDVVDVDQSVLGTYSSGDEITILEKITIESNSQLITINVPRLRVRSLPSTEGKIITSVLEGEEYFVIDAQTGWHKINYKEGKTGWVMSRYTIKID